MSKLNGKWINYQSDNLTHLGDDLAVKFSDSDAPSLNKVWSSEKISTMSGTLQTQIDNLDMGYATDLELSSVSGTLQTQIDNLDSYYATDEELSTVSGVLQTNIDNLDYYTTSEIDILVATASGSLDDSKVSRDGSTTLTADWDIGDGRKISADKIAARDSAGLYLVDDSNQGIFVEDGGAVSMTSGLTVEGGAIIYGDLVVSGTTFTTQHETVQINDNLLLINNGEVGPGVTASGGVAGIEVDRGSSTNYQFLFDEASDNFRIGEVGDLQAVATREDAPTDNYVAYWNNAETRFNTVSGTSISNVISAYNHSISAHAPSNADNTSANETSHSDVLVDGDFTSSGFMTTNGAGSYSVDTNTYALASDLSTASGTLQTQIDNLDLNYATDLELSSVSGTLQTQIDNLDYYSTSEVDSLFTTHSGSDDHDGRYYTESEVDGLFSTLSGTIYEQMVIAANINEVEYFTLTASGIANKYITLAHEPYSDSKTVMDIIGGPAQMYGADFTVSGTLFSWDGYALDGVLETGDILRIVYAHGDWIDPSFVFTIDQ